MGTVFGIQANYIFDVGRRVSTFTPDLSKDVQTIACTATSLDLTTLSNITSNKEYTLIVTNSNSADLAIALPTAVTGYSIINMNGETAITLATTKSCEISFLIVGTKIRISFIKE